MNTFQVRETFDAFRERCIWVRTCFNTFEVLYSSDGDVSELLKETAPAFFGDLNTVLQEYIFLQICNLTDPGKSWSNFERKLVPNLTVAHIDGLLKNSGVYTSEIEMVSNELMSYRSLIEKCRNKLISHFDARTILSTEILGHHDASDVICFFSNLQKYCDLAGIMLSDGPLDFTVTSGSGDVYELLKHLNCGKYPSFKRIGR